MDYISEASKFMYDEEFIVEAAIPGAIGKGIFGNDKKFDDHEMARILYNVCYHLNLFKKDLKGQRDYLAKVTAKNDAVMVPVVKNAIEHYKLAYELMTKHPKKYASLIRIAKTKFPTAAR